MFYFYANSRKSSQTPAHTKHSVPDITAQIGSKIQEKSTSNSRNGRVMNDPVDGCGCGHGVFENLVPLAEDKISGDDRPPAFISFREELEQELLGALLEISDIVEHQNFKSASTYLTGSASVVEPVAFGESTAWSQCLNP